MDAVAMALSDPTRRKILRMLRDRAVAAGDIAKAFPLSRPAISRHLRVLREAHLVRDEASGRQRSYRLDARGLDELEGFLRELRSEGGWQRRFDALATEVHRVRRGRRHGAADAQRTPGKRKRA